MGAVIYSPDDDEATSSRNTAVDDNGGDSIRSGTSFDDSDYEEQCQNHNDIDNPVYST
jgi:hypothetical protein